MNFLFEIMIVVKNLYVFLKRKSRTKNNAWKHWKIDKAKYAF